MANPPTLIFLALGLTLLGVAAWMVVVRRARFARWTRTPGVVVGHRVRRTVRNGRQRHFYHPQVRYQVAGRERVLESQLSHSQPRREVGTPVAVLYDPTAPEEACLDELLEKYFLVLFAGAMGLVFTATALWLSAQPD